MFLPDSEEGSNFALDIDSHVNASEAGHAADRRNSREYSRATQAARIAGSSRGECALPKLPPNLQRNANVFTNPPRSASRRARSLADEIFGPDTLLVHCRSTEDYLRAARALDGHLTATLLGDEDDLAANRELVQILEQKAGRLIFNGFPTGVEVTHAMVHGGPYPSTSDPRFTSVGSLAIYRFARPVCFQGFPQAMLPPELQDANPLGTRAPSRWQTRSNRARLDLVWLGSPLCQL